MSTNRIGSPPREYAHLWIHSNYSFLVGASHPDEILARASDLRIAAVAITDQNSLAGIVQAHAEHKRLSTEEFRPQLIIGAQLTVQGIGSVLLLAQDLQGYGNISSLISQGRLRNPKGYCMVTQEELCAAAPGTLLIWIREYASFLSADADLEPSMSFHSDLTLGEIPGAIIEAFRGNFYVGIARHGRPGESRLEQAVHRAASRFDLPLVATPLVRYHVSERRKLQDVVTCIRHQTTLDAAGGILAPNGLHHLFTQTLATDLYGDSSRELARTLEVAERCRFSLDELEYRYPSEYRPDGYTDAGWLRTLTFRGAETRYPDGVPVAVRTQLTKELDLIEDLQYSGYFLTMWEIVNYCRSHGILCQGRGSAANSAVCYCLGITAVDPVRMDLLFERFLSKERAEPPDIDLDIEHRRREEVIQHVYRKYGRDHAAMVANVVRYRRRSAVRDVGKVFGIQIVTLDQVSKLLANRVTTPEEAAVEAGLDGKSVRTRQFLEMVEEIRESPRHLSIHPGGFLLGRDPIHRVVPVENATMPERTVVQWDKYAVEDMNLFKVDLLGLGALTHLDYAFELLNRHLGVPLSLAAIPHRCAATYALLRRGDTVGVFQLESRAQMAMLPRLKPREFYDLVIEISIVRPGPITGGMVHPYLRRRSGEEEVIYPHPSLEPVLKKTLGVPLFQEQVMKLAVVAADYSAGEADQLRRDMAAWRKSGRIEKHRERMIDRMVAKGISEEFAERVFDQIRGFGEYGFPESHAASFALIAYATAYIRTHFPVVFACALLNAWPMGFYSPASIVTDARRHGIVVLPVDVRVSRWECTLEPVTPEGVGSGAGSSRSDESGREATTGRRGTTTSAQAPTTAGQEPTTAGRGRADVRRAASPSGGSYGASGDRRGTTTGDATYAIRMGIRFVKGLGEEDYRRIDRAREKIWGAAEAASLSRRPAPGDEEPSGEPGQRRAPASGGRGRASRSVPGAGSTANSDRASNADLLERFVRSAGLDEDVLLKLAQAGAFRSFLVARRSAFWEGLGYRERVAQAATSGQKNAVGQMGLKEIDQDQSSSGPEFAPLDDFERVAWDYLSTSHSTAAHPLEPYRGYLSGQGYPSAQDVQQMRAGTVVRYVGMVIVRQRPETAGGTVFMTLEDETGFVNLIVWESVFREFRQILLTGSFLEVTGHLQKQDTVVHLVVRECTHPVLPRTAVSLSSRDFH